MRQNILLLLFFACVFALGTYVIFDLQSGQNITKQNQAIVTQTNAIAKSNNALLDLNNALLILNAKATQKDDSLAFEILKNQKIIIDLLKKK